MSTGKKKKPITKQTTTKTNNTWTKWDTNPEITRLHFLCSPPIQRDDPRIIAWPFAHFLSRKYRWLPFCSVLWVCCWNVSGGPWEVCCAVLQVVVGLSRKVALASWQLERFTPAVKPRGQTLCFPGCQRKDELYQSPSYRLVSISSARDSHTEDSTSPGASLKAPFFSTFSMSQMAWMEPTLTAKSSVSTSLYRPAESFWKTCFSFFFISGSGQYRYS